MGGFIGVHGAGKLSPLDGFSKNIIFAKLYYLRFVFLWPCANPIWVQTGYDDGLGKLWEDPGVHLESGKAPEGSVGLLRYFERL